MILSKFCIIFVGLKLASDLKLLFDALGVLAAVRLWSVPNAYSDDDDDDDNDDDDDDDNNNDGCCISERWTD